MGKFVYNRMALNENCILHNNMKQKLSVKKRHQKSILSGTLMISDLFYVAENLYP